MAFLVSDKKYVDISKLVMVVGCVQMVSALFYGPWTKDPFNNIENKEIQIEVPPVPFPVQVSFLLILIIFL